MAKREKTSWEDEEDEEDEEDDEDDEDIEDDDEEEEAEEEKEPLATLRYGDENSGVFPYYFPIPMPFFSTVGPYCD